MADNARILTPNPKFYELFDASQVLDIVTSLNLRRAIPLQYGYFDVGAGYWSEYAKEQSEAQTPNALNRTLELLRINSSYLDALLDPYDRVDVVDLGAGDGRPVKDLLAWLQERRSLGRYIALDLSRAMLDVVKANIQVWFNGAVPFEGHVVNLTRDAFGELISERRDQESVALAVLFGGTLCNFEDPDSVLRNIQANLRDGDIFVYVVKLDTPENRNFFSLSLLSDDSSLSGGDRLLLHLLNIERSLYDVEKGFDASVCRRYLRVRLRESVKIVVNVDGAEHIVAIDEGETIMLWHFWHQNAAETSDQLLRAGFYPLLLSQHSDRQYLLCASVVHRE